MSAETGRPNCIQFELVSAFAVGALSADEAAAIEAHVAVCVACREELESLRTVVGSFVDWPVDVIRPAPSLWKRLVQRVSPESAKSFAAIPKFEEPEWEDVAPGIECKLLATDTPNARVSMLVRLAPGADYPPHTHAGVEELHLLDGELWIDDRKFFPGEYHRAEPGSADKRVWSATGCTCVLVTSTSDRLT